MAVRPQPGESIESALRRFKKETQDSAYEYRRRAQYVKPSAAKRQKSNAARKRQRKIASGSVRTLDWY